MNEYPKILFKPTQPKPQPTPPGSGSYDERTVGSEEEKDAALAEGWYESPADFGVESAPGTSPDPKIAENAENPAAKSGKTPPHHGSKEEERERAQAIKDEEEAEKRAKKGGKW
jgi:hypothetical protein